MDIWRKFVGYEEDDGYYFLQMLWLCSETKLIDWTYYPPSKFKILLKGEMVSFVCRVIITLIIELGIAFLFGFGKKTLLGKLLLVNAITQILLNMLFNIIVYDMVGTALSCGYCSYLSDFEQIHNVSNFS